MTLENKPSLEFLKQQLKYPDWYIRLQSYLEEEFFPVIHDDPELFARRMKFYKLVAEMLENNEIPLSSEGPDLDKERESIDTVVIHHLEADPDMSLRLISAIAFIRIYASRYLRNDVWGHKLRGKPIWSGHFKDGEMVFFAYHWLVRPDGIQERLLGDVYIGRHAANQDINKRSVGIVLAGNYEHSTPPYPQIESTAQLIEKHYSQVDRNRILGHREVAAERTCPGDKFLTGWKRDLLNLIE